MWIGLEQVHPERKSRSASCAGLLCLVILIAIAFAVLAAAYYGQEFISVETATVQPSHDILSKIFRNGTSLNNETTSAWT